MALIYEDTRVDRGEQGHIECWSLSRVIDGYAQVKKSVVEHRSLATIRAGRRPPGWDAWGRPWVLMDIAEEDMPKDMGIWHLPYMRGRTLKAVLVRYDEEPYYFPNAGALLNALQLNAQDEKVI